MKVKQLEWAIDDRCLDEVMEAVTNMGNYRYWHNGGDEYILDTGMTISTHIGVKATRAAAQADFEARVRECLEEDGVLNLNRAKELLGLAVHWMRKSQDYCPPRDQDVGRMLKCADLIEQELTTPSADDCLRKVKMDTGDAQEKLSEAVEAIFSANKEIVK